MNILITAGPTHEPIDAVRFIGNRSSGKLGLTLAQTAATQSHNVTLLLGPVPGSSDHDLPNLKTIRFNSTADLQALLHEHFPQNDLLIMAAAVADYTPLTQTAGKLPRSLDKTQTLTIELKPTPDLTADIAKQKQPHQRIIAFALEEPQNLKDRALAKMQRKNADAILANPLQTMDADTIQPTLYLNQKVPDNTFPSVQPDPSTISKTNFAPWLLAQLPLLFGPNKE
ncbi:phosphopantothenoylcysteine decarboxylase [Poriferisphaera sp. WC338]|uniref:phosphopantothenoylcysteine decarboxylase n=1 Tax=Poriferisphaera sp. WC338 TaxID=3425129 RepID=UPI003D81996B